VQAATLDENQERGHSIIGSAPQNCLMDAKNALLENRKAGLSSGRSAENKIFSWCGAADIRLKTLHTEHCIFAPSTP
jgi:hypothetical protein